MDLYVDTYVYTYVKICMRIYTYKCLCRQQWSEGLCVFMCDMFAYLYAFTCIHTFTYTYIHMSHLCRSGVSVCVH